MHTHLNFIFLVPLKLMLEHDGDSGMYNLYNNTIILAIHARAVGRQVAVCASKNYCLVVLNCINKR